MFSIGRFFTDTAANEYSTPLEMMKKKKQWQEIQRQRRINLPVTFLVVHIDSTYICREVDVRVHTYDVVLTQMHKSGCIKNPSKYHLTPVQVTSFTSFTSLRCQTSTMMKLAPSATVDFTLRLNKVTRLTEQETKQGENLYSVVKAT